MHDHDPLQPHRHEPNPAPPTADPDFVLERPSGDPHHVSVADLKRLQSTEVRECYIVSTGHGTSGPFTFTGVRLLDFVLHYVKDTWSVIEVLSGDGFGTRIRRSELELPDAAGPIILAYGIDGRALTRENGLIRLIVPSERDDALRQVKWVTLVRVL